MSDKMFKKFIVGAIVICLYVIINWSGEITVEQFGNQVVDNEVGHLAFSVEHESEQGVMNFIKDNVVIDTTFSQWVYFYEKDSALLLGKFSMSSLLDSENDHLLLYQIYYGHKSKKLSFRVGSRGKVKELYDYKIK